MPPDEDPARALRAKELSGARERRCIAASLENILDAADEMNADPASPLQLDHLGVLAARDDIVRLIECLRSERPLALRGIALSRLLIDDSTSPLLRPRPARTVPEAVSEAIAAL